MSEPTDADVMEDAEVAETAEIVERRNEIATRVREHASRTARRLALLDGGDYGTHSFSTDGGEWTLKYEAGDVEYLRFKPKSGSGIYAVSTKQPPEPDALATPMDDCPALIESYNEHVRELNEGLSEVSL